MERLFKQNNKKRAQLQNAKKKTGNKKLEKHMILSVIEESVLDTLGETAVYGLSEGIDGLDDDVEPNEEQNRKSITHTRDTTEKSMEYDDENEYDVETDDISEIVETKESHDIYIREEIPHTSQRNKATAGEKCKSYQSRKDHSIEHE